MLLNMVMFKVTICDFGKMNIHMTDKIEKRRAANCVYHIGASIKNLGKKWFWFLQDGNKIVQRANRPTLGLYLGYRRHFTLHKQLVRQLVVRVS